MMFEVTEEREIKLLHFSVVPFSAVDFEQLYGASVTLTENLLLGESFFGCVCVPSARVLGFLKVEFTYCIC